MLITDVVGYICLFPYVIARRLKGRRFDPEKVSRIAVFRLDGIGDLVLSGPALRALRAAFPKAGVSLFVNKWSAGLADLLDGVDEVIAFEAPMFSAFKGKTDWSALFRERKILRRRGKAGPFDLAIDLRGDFLSIVEAHWLGATWLISRASRGGGFLLTNVVSQPEEGAISEVKLDLEFIERLAGKKFDIENPRLKPVPESAKGERLRTLLQVIGTDYICLAVCAPYDIRCYPTDKWVEAIALIRQKYDGPMVILGGQNDFLRCESVASRAGGKMYNAAGKLTLPETVSCIAGCRLFIGNDGGLIHIASATGRPLVQLFGPADPVCFGHYGPNEHVIQKPCPYNPCAQTSCLVPDNWCMAQITPGEIMDAARRYL
jgi:ADP-heptose:LPS heptosyltransferase